MADPGWGMCARASRGTVCKNSSWTATGREVESPLWYRSDVAKPSCRREIRKPCAFGVLLIVLLPCGQLLCNDHHGRDDVRARAEAAPVRGLDTDHPQTTRLVEEQICDHSLRELECREALEQVAGRAPVQGSVALCPGSPDRGTLGA